MRHRVFEGHLLGPARAFGQKYRCEVRVGDPREAVCAFRSHGSFGGGLGRLLHQLILGHVVIQRALAAGGRRQGQVAKSAAPQAKVRQRIAIQRDLARDHGKIAVLLEAQDLAHHHMAVGKLIGHTQAVGVRSLFVPGPIDVGGRLLSREIERKGKVEAGDRVDQVERLAVVTLVLFQFPAAHVRALIAERDAVKIGLDDEKRFGLLRRGVRGQGRRCGTGRCSRRSGRRLSRIGGCGRGGDCRRVRVLLHRRFRRSREDVGRQEHHRPHQDEGEEEPHFHRHFFFWRLRHVVATAVDRVRHAEKFPL